MSTDGKHLCFGCSLAAIGLLGAHCGSSSRPQSSSCASDAGSDRPAPDASAGGLDASAFDASVFDAGGEQDGSGADTDGAPSDGAGGSPTTAYLSDVRWDRAQQPFSYVHPNRSVGGGPLRLGGTIYPKGLGVHAMSDVEYNLAGTCTHFDAVAGLDDEASDDGSVIFTVYADGAVVYTSPTLDPTGARQATVSLDLTAVQRLVLEVMPGIAGNTDDHADWADARFTVAAGQTFPPLPAADIGDPNDPTGDIYDYTQTWRPERDYMLDYAQIPITKLDLAIKNQTDPSNETILINTLDEAQDAFTKLDFLMCGAQKIVYLVGWQYEGHDSKYPAWGEVNAALQRPGGASALDSLRWLFGVGAQTHTIVSLHINMLDAYEDSPLWQTYYDEDVIAKDVDGGLIPGQVSGGQTSYQVDYTKEWDLGLAKTRIDGLLALLPIQTSKTVHIDAYHSQNPTNQPVGAAISPLNGNTEQEQESTQRTILRYWRQNGVDATTEELATEWNPDPFYGLRPGSWLTQPDPDIPPFLCAEVSPIQAFEGLSQNEGSATTATWSSALKMVGENFLPWYFGNNTSAEIGIEAHDNGNCSPPEPTNDQCSTFYPALWKPQTTMAYSAAGYAQATWTMPPGFAGVTAVDLYAMDVATFAYEKVQTVQIVANAITFTMQPNQGLLIVPTGTVPEP